MLIRREIFQIGDQDESQLAQALGTLRPRGKNALVMLFQGEQRALSVIHHRSRGYAVTIYEGGEFVAIDTRLPRRTRKPARWWRPFLRGPEGFFTEEELRQISSWVILGRPQPSFAELVQIA